MIAAERDVSQVADSIIHASATKSLGGGISL